MRTNDKRLLRALRGAPIDRYPFWFMRQAGRYLPEYRALRTKAGSFLDLCFNPDLATEVTVQPIRRYGMDAAILFSDILVIPWALGQELAFQEGEGPKLPPIRDRTGLTLLATELDITRLEPVYQTIRQVREILPAETALIGFAGAPWTVATYMVEGGSSRDFKHARQWFTDDPTGFGALIDRLTAATIRHLAAQVDAGVEVVQLFDSWAGALTGEAFDRWVIEPARTIVSALKARFPEVPIIGFPRGAGTQHRSYGERTGVDALSIETGLSLTWAREQLQPIVAVQGNLDPAILIAGGSALDTAVDEIVADLGRGRFVFNLGHGVLPETPVGHVAQVADRLRSLPLHAPR